MKAGPGTIYLTYDLADSASPPEELHVTGDTESELQEQTHTMISGLDDTELVYDSVSLKGNGKG